MLNLNHITTLFVLVSFFSASHVNVIGARKISDGKNPFTPKAYIQRYWQKQISNGVPAPTFLHDKASPLNNVETATSTQLANQNILSTHLPTFCSATNFLCFPTGDRENKNDDSSVFNTNLENQNFTNYDSPIEGKMVNRWPFEQGKFSESMKGQVNRWPFEQGKFSESVKDQMVNRWPFEQGKLSESVKGQRVNRWPFEQGKFSESVKGKMVNRWPFEQDKFSESVKDQMVNRWPFEQGKFSESVKEQMVNRWPFEQGKFFESMKGKMVNRWPFEQGKFSESVKGKSINRWPFEQGKFFREKMLEVGTVMPMPDIADKMLKRSFLPPVILGKIPFTSSKIEEMKEIFQASDSSSMSGMLASALGDCERAPSPGETKCCVGSVEDMINFATTVLGRNIVPKTTENTKGSKQDVMIGSVKKINGGKITQSVSCHQVLYPFLMYYCHSVPKVRVYEADLMDPKTKAKINHGVALCHEDTSVWSENHGAFIALGPGPGKIEVCHWIFENDMTWVIAD